MEKYQLKDKIALVTGAGDGIGRSISLIFADEGANVIVTDIDIEKALNIEKKINDKKNCTGIAWAIKADVTSQKEVSSMVDEVIGKFHTIDILVNNAGILYPTLIEDMAIDEWDSVIDINLKGAFLCTQAVARWMIEQRYGKIINISSVAGMGSATTEIASYAAAKAGVIQLTKSCAIELGPYGINVNAIAPGTIETAFDHIGRTPEQYKQFVEERKKRAVLGRIGTTQDIANLALFLASDDSSFICREIIAIDGGRIDRM